MREYVTQKNLTSAIDRYGNEIKRVINVLNSHLKKKGGRCLVGDKVTYADLAFAPWSRAVPLLMPEWDFKSECPEYAAWLESLLERDAVQKIYAMDEFQMSRDARSRVEEAQNSTKDTVYN